MDFLDPILNQSEGNQMAKPQMRKTAKQRMSAGELQKARCILDAEAEAIRAIHLNDEFIKAVDVLEKCKGKVVLTGMGKVGLIAMKIGTTLSSTGTPACFLHPGEAAHGDLGLIGRDDVLVTFSNSGKTREVIETIDRAKQLYKVPLIAITGHPRSPIARKCDIVLSVGQIKEPCPIGLTPSASTTAILALGDALTLSLMARKKFTKASYAKLHHGGYLGKRARKEARAEQDPRT